METFLLNALKEQGQADKYVAEQAIKFVKKLIENQHKLENKYLNKRRDCIKAPLAVYFGIISPEHIFKKMDPILKKIPWENYTTIQKGFEQFYCFLEKPFPPAYLYCNILPVHLYVLGEAPRAIFLTNCH